MSLLHMREGAMKNVKILLLSRWFFPAKSPRAFRTTELLRELAQRGHEIDFFCPQEAIFDDSIPMGRVNVYRIPMAHLLTSGGIVQYSAESTLWTACVNGARKISYFLFGVGPKDFIFSIRLYRMLKKKVNNVSYDLVLAISFPFSILVVSALYTLHKKNICCRIADCGDPLYDNPSMLKALYLKYVEKSVLQRFDWVTVPMKAAMSGYRHCCLEHRLRVVPQGFRLTELNPKENHSHVIPTFCYAGVFYEKTRDPRFFFDFLCRLEMPFVFIVYALESPFTARVLSEYKKHLGERLIIKPPIDRESLIHEMAKMDFVINFDNDNTTQRPSKLIDYAMSRRPILSFNRQTFRPEVFQAFLKGDYSEQYNVDLAQYDIRHVVDQFEALVDEKIRGDVK